METETEYDERREQRFKHEEERVRERVKLGGRKKDLERERERLIDREQAKERMRL